MSNQENATTIRLGRSSRRARGFGAILLLLGFATAVACSSRRDPTPADAQPGEPEKLSALCGEGVGTSSRDQIGWLEADVDDVTQQFHELLERVRAGEDVVPEEASQYVWLLVPGLFSDMYPSYMKGNVIALRDLGLRYREVDLTLDQTLESGAGELQKVIMDATSGGEQVVILAHSKGGVDTAAALALYPELRSRVRAFIAVQTPYAGSPIASDLQNCPAMGDFAAGILRIFGENPQAAIDLTYETRREFLSEHPYPKGVPTLCLATSRVDLRSVVSSTAFYVRNKYGVESDGLVVPVDAVIPGSRVIYLDDMDHAEAVLSGVPGFTNYRAKEVTQVLVAMALTDAE